MAVEEKLTDRSAFGGVISTLDLLHLVDVSDVTQDPAGSSYKLTINQLMTFVNANVENIYTANGTLNANRTINTATFSTLWAGSDASTVSHTFQNLNGAGNVLLQLKNAAGEVAAHELQASGIYSIATSAQSIEFSSGGANYMNWITNYVERIRLTSGGNFGINTIAPSSLLHIKGTTADNTAYSLKLDKSSNTPILYARNDGWVGVGSASPAGNGYIPAFEINSSPLVALGALVRHNAVYHDNAPIAIDKGGGLAFGGTYSNSGLITVFAGISGTKLLAGEGTEGRLNLWVRDGAGSAQVAMTSKTAGSGCYNGFGGIFTPSAVIHAKGIYADPALFVLKVESLAGLSHLSITDGGIISAPNLQTGNAGLVSGDLYVDTAAAILANGDKVVGRKV